MAIVDGGTSGYTYDNLGRTLTIPALDTQVPTAGAEAFAYYINGQTQSISQGSRTVTYALDVNTNRVALTIDSSNGANVVSHYGDDTDVPLWIDAGSSAATRTLKSVIGVAGTYTPTGGATWSLVDLHGDNVAGLTQVAVGLSYTSEYDEYGQAQNAADAGTRRYGWLATQQRAADNPGGIVVMGARTYNPTTGRFQSVDAVYGGNANSYEYCAGDPVNCSDASGNFSCHRNGHFDHWWSVLAIYYYRCDLTDANVNFIFDTGNVLGYWGLVLGAVGVLWAAAHSGIYGLAISVAVLGVLISLYFAVLVTYQYAYKYLCRHNGFYFKFSLWGMKWGPYAGAVRWTLYSWGCR